MCKAHSGQGCLASTVLFAGGEGPRGHRQVREQVAAFRGNGRARCTLCGHTQWLTFELVHLRWTIHAANQVEITIDDISIRIKQEVGKPTLQ